MSMEFKVITPDEVAVAATVEYVYLPGSLGEMGVLEHHTALITSWNQGTPLQAHGRPGGKHGGGQRLCAGQ